jgi:hypothetical protein
MRSLSALLVALLPVVAQASSPFPGGILDSTGRTAYLSAGEAVAAVDLSSGEVRWSSDQASEPLLVAGDRLYALAPSKSGRLFVRGLDLGDGGRRVFESEPIELPRWAVPENTANRSFSFRWTRDKCRLELSWQVASWASGSPRKQASGEASIDLTTGKVGARDGHETPAPATPAVLERLSVRWQSGSQGPLRAVVLEELPGSSEYQRRQALVFRRWDERGRSSSQELLRGQNLLVMSDSAGGRLWLRDGTPSPDRQAKGTAWLVVRTDDGGVLAQGVPHVPGTVAATLHGQRAYCLVVSGVRLGRGEATRRGRSLVAVDVEGGKILWRRPLLAP